MYRRRLWAVRHARGLSVLYEAAEWAMVRLYPLFERIGLKRLDPILMFVERPVKKLLFDSQSCGQCSLGSTGMACPQNCPKTVRNGPCGGVRADGNCEVKPDMPCVWVMAWEGSEKLEAGVQSIQIIQPPVDTRLKGKSAWLRSAGIRRQFESGAVDAI